MGDSDKVIVFGAAYDDVGEAMKDYAEMQEMYGDGKIGDYDSAIVTKEPGGKLVLSNGDSSGHFKGGVKGAVAGAILGIIFPPSALGLAALGAASGAAAGRVKKHLKRSDIKSLGDLLSPSESGILMVTDRVSDEAGAALMTRAKRKKAIRVEADAEKIIAAVRAAAND